MMSVILTITLDAVTIQPDDQGRVMVARLAPERGSYSPALRIAVRDDSTVWLEHMSRVDGVSRWWPMCQVPVFVDMTG